LYATSLALMSKLAATGKNIWSSILTVRGQLTLASGLPAKNKSDLRG
jgi:hypothetical protein